MGIARTCLVGFHFEELPSEIQNLILAACYTLNVRGVDELLKLGTVNKAFRRSVDQLVLAIINCETNLKLDASSLRWEKNANHQAADWILMGCVKFVRESKMRGEPQSNVYVRSFMYTVAYQMADNSFNSLGHLQGRIEVRA